MAAGFMITRILLVCLLGDLDYSSAFPTANTGYPDTWKDKGKQEIHVYATRRPLDYVRALRQPNRHTQLNNWSQTQEKPQGSLTDLSHARTKGTVRPHQPQKMLPSQPPRTNHSSVNPRGFKVHLDVPLIDLLAQNERSGSSTKGSGYGNYGTDFQPYKHSGVQIQSGVSSPVSNILGSQYLTKYDYEKENGHSVSKPKFQLDLSLPFPATSVKTSESHGHTLDLKPGSTFAQNRYMEPVKVQSASAQTGSKWQPWPGTEYKQEPQQMGLKWPFLSHAGSGHQTQQKPVYTKPADDKLGISSWFSSQNKNPQHLSQDKTLSGQDWGFQKPDMDKFPSLPTSKYPEHPLLYFSHTSFPREDYGKDQREYPDPPKSQFPWRPQQYSIPNRGYSEGKNIAPSTSGPSKVHVQSGILPDSDLLSKGSTKNPNDGKSDQENLQQSIQLTLTVPIPDKSLDLVKNGSGHLVNIKPPGTGPVGGYIVSPKPQQISTQTGLKWPSNYQTGHEQTRWQTYEPFHVKIADGKPTLPSWHSSKDQIPSGSSLEFQKLGITSFPSLPISKYPEYADYSTHTSLPRKDYKDPTFQPDPFQKVVTSYPVGSPFTLASESYDYNQFKPSDRTQNVKTANSRPLNPFDFSSSGYSHSDVSIDYDARKGQKHVSSPYQYSHRVEPSHLNASYSLPSSLTLSTAYNSQKAFPTYVDAHKRDENKKFTGLLINLEGGSDGLAGKTYFAAETPPYKYDYPGKWIGKNTAGINPNPSHVNLQAQVSMKKDSFKELLESPFPNEKLQSYRQSEQGNRRYFPEQVGYSPVVQTDAGLVPKDTRLYLSGGLRPIQDAFRFHQ